MAGYIEKGKITSIDGNTARVVPCNESGLVSAQVVIPWHMRGSTGNIGKGRWQRVRELRVRYGRHPQR